MNRNRTGRRNFGVVISALVAFGACGLEEDSAKNACAVDDDCIAPHTCQAGICRNPQPGCDGLDCAGPGGSNAEGGSVGTGGASGNGGSSETGGASGNGGSSETGGASGDGGSDSDGGSGAAGGSAGAAGAAGGSGDEVCDGVNGGVAFGDHCYVDVTTDAWTHPEAVVACDSYASGLSRPGYLLVIDSPQEQTFILETFMVAFTDVADAWLSLTCPVEQHPDLTDCYCTSCSAAMRTAKRQNWSWRENAPANFGWAEGNPNGDGRCAALAYLPVPEVWGWGDHVCDSATFEAQDGGEHTHRAICELE